jgi:hypothetical protein
MRTPKIRRTKKLVEKQCSFVDLDKKRCSKIFHGTGKSLYCLEHRKSKYRKIIDKEKIEAKIKYMKKNTPNQTINHKYAESQTVIMNCSLEGCNETFEVKIFPNVYCYPKYCSAHRNEYRRKRFLETGERIEVQSI